MSKKVFSRIVVLLTVMGVMAFSATVYAFSVPNGDFETTPAWSEYSSNGVGLVCDYCWPTYNANHAAYLAGLNDEVSQVSQVVTLPPTPYMTVYFDYWIDSQEVGCHYDTVEVRVTDSMGHMHVVPTNLPHALCSANNASQAWGFADLSAFTGQTITLSFHSTTDGSVLSHFAVDNIVLDDVSP